jgi:hypothetical protein
MRLVNHSSQRQLEGLALDHRRIEEVLAGIEYGLAKHPEVFEKIPGGNDCMVTTYFYPDAPPHSVLRIMPKRYILKLSSLQNRKPRSGRKDLILD